MGFLKELIQGKLESSIKDTVKDSFRDTIKTIEHELSRAIFTRVNHFKRILIKELISIFILLIALCFLGLSIVFLLIEILGVSKTLSFAIIGIILLIIGLLVRIK